MKITADNYTIESDHHGYSLTVKVPSDHVKSKTGFTEVKSFHANLTQVAAKMVCHSISVFEVNNVQLLIDEMNQQVNHLVVAMERAE